MVDKYSHGMNKELSWSDYWLALGDLAFCYGYLKSFQQYTATNQSQKDQIGEVMEKIQKAIDTLKKD